MATLTVVVLTLNEEANIAACLEGVRWADEVMVLDSGSTDRTVEIARRFTPHVLAVEWKGYGATRNIALDRATGDWVLWLDADERVTGDLGREIRETLQRGPGSPAAYDVARRAYFLGKWIRHCGWYPGRVTRLFRRGSARFNDARVHEQLVVEGPVGSLRNDLLHYTDPDLEHYFRKFNRYTTLAAEELQAAGRRATAWDLTVRPLFAFLKMYVLRLGVLDGMHGFILCTLSSAYVFTKYAKLWERTRVGGAR
jgi:glycosyltransferase involved in cell wall biosynthesis